MQTSPPARPSRRIRSRLALAGAGLLLLALALAPVALGRAATARRHSCSSTSRARHASHATRCMKHRRAGTTHTKQVSSHKAAGKPVSQKTSARVPLRCEDGTLPVREGSEEFSCKDEASPSCPDGSEPELSSDGTVLTCPAARGASKEEGVPAEACEVSGEEEAAACALTEEEES